LKPTVTIMLKPWSTYAWIFEAYSDASFGTTAGGFAAPIAAAPAWTPLYVYSL
jgi:hypothetical protein